MGEPVSTTVTELADSRVRVDVRVPAQEIEARVQRSARRLGRELKLPGFRKGKVPPALVLQRVGREAVLDAAVRDSLGSWYVQAIRDAGDRARRRSRDRPRRAARAGRRPRVLDRDRRAAGGRAGRVLGAQVGRREPQVAEEQIEQEIEAMRERLARLERVERPAAEGDYVVVDYVGRLPRRRTRTRPGESTLVPFEGGEGRDQLIELGGGNLIPGFEEGLLGAGAGETRNVE